MTADTDEMAPAAVRPARVEDASAIAAMCIAPLLANTTSIFAYLQKMNGMYFIPIFAVVLIGMITKRVPAIAAKAALVVGFTVIAVGYFMWPFSAVVDSIHEFHFLGLVFAWLLILMLVIGEIWPRETEFVQEDVGAVDMTPWKHAKPVGLALIAIVLTIYVTFADFNVLVDPDADAAAEVAAEMDSGIMASESIDSSAGPESSGEAVTNANQDQPEE